MSRNFNFPVWGTQGGGLVREVNGTYIFVTKPDCPGLDVGDEMPAEWGIAPANDLALQDHSEMDAGLAEFYSALTAAVVSDKITHEEARFFSPDSIRSRHQ